MVVLWGGGGVSNLTAEAFVDDWLASWLQFLDESSLSVDALGHPVCPWHQTTLTWVCQNYALKARLSTDLQSSSVGCFSTEPVHTATPLLKDRKTVNSDWLYQPLTAKGLWRVPQISAACTMKSDLLLHQCLPVLTLQLPLFNCWLKKARIWSFACLTHQTWPQVTGFCFHSSKKKKKKLWGMHFQSSEDTWTFFNGIVFTLSHTRWSGVMDRWYERWHRHQSCGRASKLREE